MWNIIVQMVCFSFFTTSKLCGELNALLMLCHGDIHDLRASKWSMTYGKGFWVKQTQSWSHLVLSDQSLSVSLKSYVAETAVKTERWLGEQGDESSITWRMEKSHGIVRGDDELCEKAVKQISLYWLRGRLVHVSQNICALIYSQQILWGPRAT